MLSIEFLKNRLEKTRDMALVLTAGTPPTPPWTWEGKPTPEWVSDYTLLEQWIIAESAKRTAWRNAAEVWQANLNEVQRITRDVARKGVWRFRNDAAKAKLFNDLETGGIARGDVYAQGLAARDAWELAEPGWQLSPQNTLGAFSSLLASVLTLQDTHSKKETAWRLAANALMSKAAALDQQCIAWYADAVRQFPAGTTEGDTIRQTVPTTTRPETPVGQAVISNVMVTGGDIHFDAAATGATRFTYLQQTPGSPAFVVVLADSPLQSLTLHGQVAGLHRFKAFGRNSRGEGAESAVAEITVSQQAVA